MSINTLIGQLKSRRNLTEVPALWKNTVAKTFLQIDRENTSEKSTNTFRSLELQLKKVYMNFMGVFALSRNIFSNSANNIDASKQSAFFDTL